MAKKIILDDSKLMFGNQFSKSGKKKTTTKKTSAKKSTKGKKK